ncbi:hypothetical protein Pan5_48 [Pseudanabaena phage Pan5]|nr:hypothetical protein Pan5_48 [Pseudanabaena phage Pan5]
MEIQKQKLAPILFSTPMIQAILDGRKTMTRRIVPEKIVDKYYEYDDFVTSVAPRDIPCKRTWEKEFYEERTKYRIGDILWVRETWASATDIPEFDPISGLEDYSDLFIYRADFNNGPVDWNWKPSIFMPREACRIFLEVTDVRAQKLWQLNEQDAIAEGIESFRPLPGDGPAATMYRDYTGGPWTPNPLESFKSLWRSINGDWNHDQWVWVYSFKRIEKPE